MGDVKFKQLDPPLNQGELPICFIVQKKFMVAPEFFSHPRYPLPMILKKLAGETELTHQERVKRYMLACDDQKFSDMANIIDPENQFQIGFFNLYNEATEQRIQMRGSSEDKFKCMIF